MDPYLASYSAEGPFYALLQLAKIIMRSEFGKLTLYETFEKEALNEKIVVWPHLDFFVYVSIPSKNLRYDLSFC
jgi:hypothetical protein